MCIRDRGERYQLRKLKYLQLSLEDYGEVTERTILSFAPIEHDEYKESKQRKFCANN